MEKPKYNRVFKMSFDIAEPENMSYDEVESLMRQIENTIDSFYDAKGIPLMFLSVGSEIEDMSHAYTEDMVKDLSK